MRLRLIFSLFTALVIFNNSIAQTQSNAYQYKVDLLNVKNDQVKIELIVPEHTYGESVEFLMPKIVPGTYSIYDFGRFLHDFSATSKDGKALKVEKLSPNRWKISNAKQLHKISYWLEDSYDTGKDTVIFEPAGTNIEEGKNYLINTFGFFGYLDSMLQRPFDLTILKPEGFYGATPLKGLQHTDKSDRFLSINYYELIDSPIMYSIPDTSSIHLGNTEVMVSVYSPNGEMKAKEVMKNTSKILRAQAAYLGGNLPVDKYVIIIYAFADLPLSKASGALEHSFSTVLSIREESAEDAAQQIISVTAHEFFHVITPLTIHSEEIQYFDFQDPKMSKHLWLYEGLTEYAAGHVQIKEGLIDLEDYLQMMSRKIKYSKAAFNDTLPFTVLSTETLGEHQDQYPNVYMKGALIGLCLDIELRDLSDGKYGTQNLLSDLSQLYGKNKAFKDDELFDEITKLTYPQISDFFKNYVEGSKTIPYDTYFEKIGVEYYDTLTEKDISFGGMTLGFNQETNRLVVRNIDNLNEFGKEIGYLKDDELVSINGVEITGTNFNSIMPEIKSKIKSGDIVKIEFARLNKKGKEEIITASAPALEILKVNKDVLQIMETPSERQIKIRKAWGNI